MPIKRYQHIQTNVLTTHTKDKYRPMAQSMGQLVHKMRQHSVQKTQGQTGHELIKKEKEIKNTKTINHKQSASVEGKHSTAKRKIVIMKNRTTVLGKLNSI